MDHEAKLLKFPAHGTDSQHSAPEQEQHGESQVQVASTPPTSKRTYPPIWMQRFFLVTTVIFCLWVGLVLCVLPWLPAWTENALVSDYPTLRWFLGTGFIRGLATGLGLLDLWIGISEAVHYRDRR
jgi:hypothetical protein